MPAFSCGRWARLLLVATTCTRSSTATNVAVALDVNAAGTFLSRAFSAAATVSHLFIDGGEISYLDNGVPVHTTDNNTYGILVAKSWTTDNVNIFSIPKTAPVLNNGALWADRINGAMFAFGGEQSSLLQNPVPSTSLWKFNQDARGGIWTELMTPSGYTRPAGGMSTSGGFQGHYLGGYVSSETSEETAGVVGKEGVSGLLQYNFATNTWSNQSSANLTPSGMGIFGEMHWIGAFATTGILVAIGGNTANVGSWVDNGSSLRSFNQISVYNIATQTWGRQTASGQIPTPRDRFCSVGIQSEDGTYEIFLFGGHVASEGASDPLLSTSSAQQQENLAMDEVYSLSLPAFNWQKAQYNPTWPRVGHSCAVIGKRYMAVVGGVNPTASNDTQLYFTQDPWPQGIGLFDMTQAAWTTSYNAAALRYTSPQMVKNWYANHGRYPATWDDPSLEAYFMGSTATVSSTATSTAVSSTGASTKTASASPSSAPTSPALLTGIIVIAVFLAAVIVGLAWFLLRRCRKRRGGRPKLSRDASHSLVKSAEDPATNSVELTAAERSELPVFEAGYNMNTLSVAEGPRRLFEALPTGAERYELESPRIGTDTVTSKDTSTVTGTTSGTRMYKSKGTSKGKVTATGTELSVASTVMHEMPG